MLTVPSLPLQFYSHSLVSVICFGLLIQNYINLRRYGGRTYSSYYLNLFVLSMIVAAFFEIMYGLREANVLPNTAFCLYLAEIPYTSAMLLAAFFWYLSSEIAQESPMTNTRLKRNLLFLPFLALAIFGALTPWHKLVFYYEDGHYVRGPLMLLFTILPCIFILGTCIMALVNSFRIKFYLKKHYFRIIFFYAVVLLINQTIQTLLGPLLPFRTLGIVLVVHLIQQRLLKSFIFSDALTGANNRNAAERYMDARFRNPLANLQIAIIDLDYFKRINDEFGHDKGDEALQLFTKVFQRNLKQGVFFARFGGDEFFIADDSSSPERLELCIKAAKQDLKITCEEQNLPYRLSFSYGILSKSPEMLSIPDFLAAADKEMYMHKKINKLKRK